MQLHQMALVDNPRRPAPVVPAMVATGEHRMYHHPRPTVVDDARGSSMSGARIPHSGGAV